MGVDNGMVAGAGLDLARGVWQAHEPSTRLMLEKEAPEPKRSRFDATAASPGLKMKT